MTGRASISERGPEADLLFSTARFRMTEGVADRIRVAAQKDVDWIHLIELALQHETAALLCRNLQRICPDSVPAGVLEPLAARCCMQKTEAQRRAHELVSILQALQNRGIFAVTYKGLALAQRLYGDLSLRDFSDRSDLDIMIHARNLSSAIEVLVNQGYCPAFRQGITNPDEYVRIDRELLFRHEPDDGRVLELQWRFIVERARIRQDPDHFLRRVEWVSLAGTRVPSLPLESYALVLSIHATQHKWRKLKLICDIAEILQSPQVDWDCLLRDAVDLGLSRMLAVGILLAEDTLGVVAPTGLAERLKIDRTASLLATQCRQTLLKEPDKTWWGVAEDDFLLRSRERLRDRTSIFLQNTFLPKFIPDERDRRLIPLPQSLSALYYFVRPVRLVWEKMNEHP